MNYSLDWDGPGERDCDRSERMGDSDTLSWLLAPFFSGNRMPHMSGDPRDRLSPMRRRDLDEAVQAIIAAGFAQIGTGGDCVDIGWQPIETAPTDGTWVWVFVAEREGLPSFQCPCAYHPDGGWCCDELREVTHWRPLQYYPEPSQ